MYNFVKTISHNVADEVLNRFRNTYEIPDDIILDIEDDELNVLGDGIKGNNHEEFFTISGEITNRNSSPFWVVEFVYKKNTDVEVTFNLPDNFPYLSRNPTTSETTTPEQLSVRHSTKINRRSRLFKKFIERFPSLDHELVGDQFVNEQTKKTFEIFRTGWISHPQEQWIQAFIIGRLDDEGLHFSQEPNVHTSTFRVRKEVVRLSEQHPDKVFCIFGTHNQQAAEYLIKKANLWREAKKQRIKNNVPKEKVTLKI